MLSKPFYICGAAALLLVGVTSVALSGKAQTKETKGQTKELAASPQSKSGDPVARFTATTENVVDSREPIRIDLIRWSTDAERDQLPMVWNQALARAAAVKTAAAAHHAESSVPSKGGAPSRPGPPSRPGASPLQAALTPRGSLYAALEKMPTLGYLWSSSEISGYTIKYAVELPQPDGGEHVILISDRKLGDQDSQWNFVGASATKPPVASTTADETGSDGRPNQYDEYSIIELHLNARGQGEGKISRDYGITIDNTSKALELPNYGDLPVVLGNVQWRKSSAARKAS